MQIGINCVISYVSGEQFPAEWFIRIPTNFLLSFSFFNWNGLEFAHDSIGDGPGPREGNETILFFLHLKQNFIDIFVRTWKFSWVWQFFYWNELLDFHSICGKLISRARNRFASTLFSITLIYARIHSTRAKFCIVCVRVFIIYFFEKMFNNIIE